MNTFLSINFLPDVSSNYNLWADFTLTECYVATRNKSIAEYLLRRPCDEVIEEETKE